ncbi:MAG: FAD-dependent thymidylate synthase [Candidatus Bilamarchaeaceae archaeon]
MAGRRVYNIMGYPEETIAVGFAKTSRSPEPFDEMLKQISDDESKKFHEKWVISYGHGSVAEHAGVHIAVENASRLAVESIQATRLGSYTEKSTRYQVIDENSVYVPKEIEADERLLPLYKGAMQGLFEAYNAAIAGLIEYYRKQEPDGKDAKLRLKAIDSARFLLPNATYANVGVTMNARAMAHTISRMLASPLLEVREIGEEIKAEMQKSAPTLGKYIDKNKYLEETENGLSARFSKLKTAEKKKIRLISYEKDGVEKIAKALVFRHSNADFGSPVDKGAIIADAVARMGEHDEPIREFEHVNYTFELIMDQGAYYEFKRHRMCTQSAQDVTIYDGYVVPEDIMGAGLNEMYLRAIGKAEDAYREIERKDKRLAAYVATNAHNRRVLATMNLREIFHFVKERSSPHAHFTIREVALNIHDEVAKVHPELAAVLRTRS